MRHHNTNRKFGRTRGQRDALLKGLAVAFFTKEKIQTTAAKAKELRPLVEKIVTRAKTDTVHARRLVAARVDNNEAVVTKLFAQIGPRYKERTGGYTRITKVAPRAGRADGSPMAVIEFI